VLCSRPCFSILNINYLHIFVEKLVMLELVTDFPPKDAEWTDVEFKSAVVYSFGFQVMMFRMSYQRGDRRAQAFTVEANRAKKVCLEARPNDATMYVVAGNFLMVQG
jgi:hypothetical protein